MKTVLLSQGYDVVHTNVVDAGGNELDIKASRTTPVLSATETSQLIGEAKAYADPVATPAWQRFLGKIFLERSDRAHTAGVLIALNGVNGNVRGSYNQLRQRETSITIVDGDDLLARATSVGEVAPELQIRERAAAQFSQVPAHVEAAYYGGGYLWIVHWAAQRFSVVDGLGALFSAERVEELRAALEASLSGELVAYAEAIAEAEAAHSAKVQAISQLLQGHRLHESTPDAVREALLAEPYCSAGLDGEVELIAPSQLDVDSISRFFVSLFERTVPVEALSFMAEGHHNGHVARLLEVLPDIHPGVDAEFVANGDLAAIAPFFPSVWARLSRTLPSASHDVDSSPEVAVVNRNALSEAVLAAVRTDFANTFLRGYLYDILGVVELEEEKRLVVKSKTASVGVLTAHTRDALGRLSDELVGEAGTRHWLIRLLPSAPEPWEHGHPDGDASEWEAQ
ncbi:MAG: hypothetical protein IJG47_06175 [Microbacterium sp.]|nr:hypothetical protein [Microbacterium sp.]